MADGTGGSFGRALLEGIRAAGRSRSYTATGWHAQISKLTSSPRGYAAADKAGLSVTRETLTNWLTETTTPNAANRAKIAAAYEAMARPTALPQAVKTAVIEITGLVKLGDDERHRGRGSAPFRVDGRNGNWTRIERLLEDHDDDDDDDLTEVLEDLYWEDVVLEDLTDLSSGSSGGFPGSWYTVSV